MSDLIRRQEVIIALRESGLCYNNWLEVLGVIDAVPSADRPTEWIPCSERMPDAEYGEGDSVLCCTELGLMYILYWHGGNWCVTTGEPHQWVNHKTGWHDKVIAWMQLPTPYKGGEEE